MKKKRIRVPVPNPVLFKLWKIMRLSVFFLLLFVAQTYATVTYSQETRLTFKMQGAKVIDILNKIENESQFYFLFNQKMVDVERQVSIEVKNESIDKILTRIFENTNVSYLVKDRQIVLTTANSEAEVIQQQKSVTGKVTDPTGATLPGVSVIVKGTTTGTITDANGNYILGNLPANATLQFSFVGMKVQDVIVGNRASVNVVMTEETVGLDEVVAIGYGTVKKRDLTGSVSSIKREEIGLLPTNNALSSLQGKISGLDLTKTDGQAGAGLSFSLRGTRSLNADNGPLILVDGISYGSTLDVSPSDIESIEVLKDASSTAIYGSRGANGVILVTTKKGKSGKAVISFNSYYATQNPSGLPDIQTGEEYVAFKREAYRTQGITDDTKIFNADELTGIKNNEYTDWMRECLTNGFVQNNELNITGGNEKTTFNLSAGVYNEHGLLKNDKFKRYNGSIGLTHSLLSNLKVGANVLYSYKDNDKRFDPLNQANKVIPIGKAYDDNGNIILNPILGSAYNMSPLADEIPGSYVDNRINKRVFFSSTIDWAILKNLAFKSTLGLDIQDGRRGYYIGKNTISGAGAKSTSGVETTNFLATTFDNTLTYTKDLGVHNFTVLLGSSYISNKTEAFNGKGNNQVSGTTSFYDLNSNAIEKNIGSSLVELEMMSYFGRFNYKFKDRYLLTASLRADGSSVLAKGHKMGYFPSVALAWRMKEESFLKGVDVLSNLKLRTSWGEAGNSAISPYQTLGGLGKTTYSFDETAAYGYYPKALANSNLKWETTRTVNLALDFGFFKDRLNGTIEIYESNTRDLLMSRVLPGTSGFSSVMENIGKTRNRGIEIAINTVNFRSSGPKGFTWTSDFTYSKNNEEIVELTNGSDRDLGNLWFVGSPIKVWYDYKKIGIWQLGEEAEALKYGQKPGDIKVLDVNKDGKIDATNDRIIVGTPRPKYSLGLNNKIAYKGFDLSTFLYARVGQTIMSEASGNYKISGMENGPKVDYWTPENPTNSHPRPDQSKTANSAYMSTLYYVSGSFLKIRDITIGYSLPSHLTDRIGFSKLRVYSTFNNFFTFSKMKPYDPERGGSISFPMTRQVVLGVNVSF